MSAVATNLPSIKDLAEKFGVDKELAADFNELTGALFGPPRVNGASPISLPGPGRRRGRTQIAGLREALYELVAEQQPMTVRQVFYQMVSCGLVKKTEIEYDHTVCRLLSEMRRAGDMPYQWIADNTRWMRKPKTHHGLDSALEETRRTYRRALWDGQNAYVEIWLEKDALAGVLLEVTKEWDVPLMVTRGYSSLSFLHSAAEAIADEDRPVYLYYFGDHDPTGIHIPQNAEARLRELAPDADIHFRVVAVLPEQIEAWQLPTRPTKTSDTRSRKFQGESVEVDAIPPAHLREIARQCITQHIDQEELERLRTIEAAERDGLQDFIRKWRRARLAKLEREMG